MKEFLFNRKDYKSYEEMYKDMAIKFRDVETKDYYDTTCFDYSPDILWEFLLCEYGYTKDFVKIILINFDRPKINEQKNYNDYELNMIIEV